MEIRKLLADDAGEWSRLRRESLEHEPLAFGKSVEEHDSMPLETIVARFQNAPQRDARLGAFENGKMIGMVTFLRDSSVKGGHKGGVYGVYVTPGRRGHGIGRALLEEVIRHAESDPSLEQIMLAVATDQTAAKALYRSLGFESWGTEPRAMKVGAQYVSEEYMVRFRTGAA